MGELLKRVQEKKNEKRNVKCQFIFCAAIDASELISGAEIILTLHLVVVARRWSSAAKTDCSTNNAGRNDEKTAHGHQDKPRQF